MCRCTDMHMQILRSVSIPTCAMQSNTQLVASTTATYAATRLCPRPGCNGSEGRVTFKLETEGISAVPGGRPGRAREAVTFKKVG